jgi:hypothetical protein
LPMIMQALASTVVGTKAAGALKAKKGAPDMGANCARGSDCAAGACVTVGAQRYCSRPCGAHDGCPAHFRCEQSREGEAVCIEK